MSFFFCQKSLFKSTQDKSFKIFLITVGPVHSNIYIMVHPGVHLVSWSIGNHRPYPTNTPVRHLRSDYFIYYSHGTKPDKPYVFWIDLLVRFIRLFLITSVAPLKCDMFRVNFRLSNATKFLLYGSCSCLFRLTKLTTFIVVPFLTIANIRKTRKALKRN